MSKGQSPSPELRDWVVAQLAEGHSVAALGASMRDAGWHNDIVEAVLSDVEQRSPVSVQVMEGTPAIKMPGPDLSVSPLYIDAGDRRVQVLQTMRHPRIVVFGDLVSDEECDGLISAARQRLARSMTVETQTGGEMPHVDRTSEGMFFNRGENPIVARVEQRIAALLRWPLEFGEPLQILRYSRGAEYRPHYDYFPPDGPGTPTILKRGGQRVATLVMYLQEPEHGGGTTFPDVGLEVAPKRGTAVFFTYDRPDPTTCTLHGGAPVLAGEKWVATKWLREREFV